MSVSQTTNGVASFVRGEGTPIIMLHGFPLDHRALLPLDSVIEHHGNWKRIYIDLPGMGESSKCEGIDGSQAVLERVIAVIKELVGGQKFASIGYSFGGLLGRAIATEMKSQVLGLCLLCPEIINDAAGRSLPHVSKNRESPEFLSELSRSDRASYLHTAVSITYENWLLFREYILPGLQAFNPDTIGAIDGNRALSLPSKKMRHSGPTLVLTGKQDNMVGYSDSLSLLDLYPKMTFSVLDGGGHTLHLDKPEPVHALVSQWLSDLRGSTDVDAKQVAQ